ncbi:MAG: AMP-binding protein, partial [Bacteroidales bacterium]|nr:AMP-binding protein [Bacteroidales bacterium]
MKHEIFHLGLLPQEQAKKRGSHTALRHRDDATGQWVPTSWKKFAAEVDALACAMLANGVQVQENMGVFTNNMPQGLCTDFAAFAIRAVTIPLYATSSETQVQYIVNDAQIRFLFVGEQQQYDTAFRVHSVCPSLEKLIIFDPKVVK